MALLLMLANELLLQIFKELGDIDDVLHLGQTCKHLYNLLEFGRNRLHAEHHKYDLRLCYLIEMNQQYTSSYSTHQGSPPASSRPQSSVFWRLYAASEDTLSDHFTWWIVCRWQGLRLLEDLYLNQSTHSAFCCSVFPYDDEHVSNENVRYNICDALAAEEPLARPPIETFQRSRTLSSFRQTQRFYQVLTAHWFAVEALCLARVSAYPTVSEQLKVFAQVAVIWQEGHGRTLSESLDMVEICDFVWGFLGRKIFSNVQDCPSWIQGEEDMGFFPDDEEPENSKWDYFVKCTLQYLRPPNIIELLLLSVWNQSWPSSKPKYLRQLGIFDTWAGTALVQDQGSSPDPWFPLGLVENSALQWFKEICRDSDPSLVNAWREYREKSWASNARGKALSWKESDEWIVEHIVTTISSNIVHS
ncbi:hypothetical protein ACJ73_08091 [Blastomyces percursus]|uniref:F-box domain-containing protein n=1 Tax=Blastomyces percursus TaxID=1658174 RepID=A0A1J9QK64_9EURO|nr:hypothetical protein ACJ73_08091 [Blastomyces percursus]